MSRPGNAEPLLAVGLVVMWSSGFIGAELGTRHAPTTTLLAWRFLIVAAGLAAWLLLRRSRISRRDLGLHALIGVLAQAGYLYGVVAAAEYGVAPGTSALIAALQPVVAVVLAGRLLGERATLAQAAGLGVGLAGVAIVVSADLGAGDGPLWAYGLPFAGMLSLVAATLLERRTRPAAGLLEALAVQCAVSAVCFTGLAAASGTLAPPAEPGFWYAVGWVVVLSTLGGYGLYWVNLARTDVARVSGLLYLTPPATVVWAWLMFGEALTWRATGGLAVCAAAVLLIRHGTANTPTPGAEAGIDHGRYPVRRAAGGTPRAPGAP